MSFITQGKTNWKFLLVVIVLAVVVGAAALWYTKQIGQLYQSAEIKKTENVIQDETANWETYINQIHKFEIKYPKEWMLQKEVGVPPATIISYRWPDNGYCSLNMLIVSDNTDNSFEMNWYRQNGYQEESYVIGGVAGVKFSKFLTENSAPVGVIYFNNNSDRIDMVASTDKYQYCINIFNQMLSTFKFIQ